MPENEKKEPDIINHAERMYYVSDDEEQTSQRKPYRKNSLAGVLLPAAVLAFVVFAGSADTGSVNLFWEFVKKAAAELSCASAELTLLRIGNAAAGFTEKIEAELEWENISPSGGNNTVKTIIGDDAMMLSYGSRRMPSSDNEELFTSEDLLGAPSAEDASVAAEDGGSVTGSKITKVTYGYYTGESYLDLQGGGQLRNLTSLSNDEVYRNTIGGLPFSIELNADENSPQVLIMHTHTTECYEGDQSDYTYRTLDDSVNMVSVGDRMAQVLESRGIRVYHDVTVHDYPSYNGSYDLSRETVQKLLEEYPSIKVVLDIHRDAIERENGEIIAPYAEIDGIQSAQVMIICGCDDGTMGMPDCMQNLRTAAAFQESMESKYPGLTRPILYDYRKYNQDLSTGSLLIEIGGHANSHDEALAAAELSADAIADALIISAG